jgi:hypothetical protein
MSALIVRRDATQATLDRFKDVPFEWGRADCAKMLAFHLRGLGHELRLAKAGSYRTMLGAKRALRRLGFASLGAAIDAHGLMPIAPAAALAGDLVELPAEDEMGCITIAIGTGRVFGYNQGAPGAAVLQPLAYVRAWRADPR